MLLRFATFLLFCLLPFKGFALDCIELIEEIKFLENRKFLYEQGFSKDQSKSIINLLHQYEIPPDKISSLNSPTSFDLNKIEQELLEKMIVRYPYPKDWSPFINPDVFPLKPAHLEAKKVLSITNIGDEKLLSYSGFDNKSILRDIRRVFGGDNVKVFDAKGNPITRGTLDSNIGKKIRIVDTSKKPGRVLGEYTLGLKKSKYKEGSLPQLETGADQKLKLIREEELLRKKMESLPRHADAEIRQLEYLNDLFRRTPPAKRPKEILIKTTKAPCESCYRAIKTFQKRYGITINMEAKEAYLP